MFLGDSGGRRPDAALGEDKPAGEGTGGRRPGGRPCGGGRPDDEEDDGGEDIETRGTRACLSGGHYWDFCHGALSLNQVTATNMEIGHL